ncbi:hypothetical protein [Pseudorhodoplanes sp.]|uniref:hypothetical protein n=1 Tax=Pseudorhodoplanes sp. TaxID=1934341 RepID=UPI003D135CCA
MRTTVTLVATSIMIGAAVIAAPGIAQARFGAGAIADTAVNMAATQPTQFSAQQRSQRSPRRTTPRRTYSPPPNTTSPYIYPGSRGALLNCSFC